MRGIINVLNESQQLNEGSYWSHNGRFEDEANELAALVPASGSAETLRGEIMRAASKIYYDLHNNGFGNNWTGALDFLKQYADIPAVTYAELNTVAGGTVVGRSDHYSEIMEALLDHVVRYIMDNVDPTTPTPVDMHTLRRPDYDTGDYDDDETEYDDDTWEDEDAFDDGSRRY